MNRPMMTAISVMDGLFSTPKSAVYAKTSGEMEISPVIYVQGSGQQMHDTYFAANGDYKSNVSLLD